MTEPLTDSRPWLVPALWAIALLTASCGSSPTSPALVPGADSAAVAPPAAGGTAAATGANTTRLDFAVDLTVPAYPICPQTPVSAGELHGDGVLTVILRSLTDPNGGTRVGSSIHGHGTATDAFGNRWIWSDADLNNELFPSGNTSANSFERTIREGFHVVGPKGLQIKVSGVFHITEVDGAAVVEVEHGNHEDAETCESGFTLTPLP